MIAMELLDDPEQEMGAYIFERRELNILIKDGVPKELFVNAYFENYNPDNHVSGTPALDKLFDKIREIKGENFMEEFDLKF